MPIKNTLYCIILSIGLFGCSPAKKARPMHYIYKAKTDTISGYFLYEVNVPDLCYTKAYSIDQDAALIFYSDSIRTIDITEIYKKGVIAITHQPYILSNHFLIEQDKSSLSKFHTDIFRFYYIKDDSDKRLTKDKSGLLTFKKVYARLVVADLGKLEILVPYMKNGTCCYSNKKIKDEVYFVTAVLDYNLD